MPKTRIESSLGTVVKVGQTRLPRTFAVVLYDDERGRPDVRAEFKVRGGVPSCRDVRVQARGDREVRASDLAAIRIADLLDLAVRNLVLGDVREIAPGEYLVSPSATDEQRRRGVSEVTGARRRRIGGIDLARVAQVYRVNVKDAPTQAVADAFGIAHRTAALYVKSARDAGVLGKAIPGKAGEQE